MHVCVMLLTLQDLDTVLFCRDSLLPRCSLSTLGGSWRQEWTRDVLKACTWRSGHRHPCPVILGCKFSHSLEFWEVERLEGAANSNRPPLRLNAQLCCWHQATITLIDCVYGDLRHGHVGIVGILVAGGKMSVNARDSSGSSPLHVAAGST